MSLLDQLKDGLEKVFPARHKPTSMSGGIGSGHVMVAPGDDVSAHYLHLPLFDASFFRMNVAVPCHSIFNIYFPLYIIMFLWLSPV
jgi:hypothetical protein